MNHVTLGAPMPLALTHARGLARRCPDCRQRVLMGSCVCGARATLWCDLCQSRCAHIEALDLNVNQLMRNASSSDEAERAASHATLRLGALAAVDTAYADAGATWVDATPDTRHSAPSETGYFAPALTFLAMLAESSTRAHWMLTSLARTGSADTAIEVLVATRAGRVARRPLLTLAEIWHARFQQDLSAQARGQSVVRGVVATANRLRPHRASQLSTWELHVLESAIDVYAGRAVQASAQVADNESRAAR